MPRSTKQLLIDAKQRIKNPADWCQGTYGERWEKGAGYEKLCSYGALNEETRDETESYYNAMMLFRDLVQEKGESGGLISYNDTHSHPEVMALWDEAIARA